MQQKDSEQMQPDLPSSEGKSAKLEFLEEVQLRAKALWPRIASEIGVPATGVTFRTLRGNSKYMDRRCVLEITSADGRRQVLRADFDTQGNDHHLKFRARHQDAAIGLRTIEGVSVPSILWADPEMDVMLMDVAPGETLFRELSYAELGIGDRAGALQRVGRGIMELHRCSATENRVFWPKFQLAEVTRKAAAVRSGEIEIRKQHRFLGLCAMMHRAAQRAKGLSYMGAIEHGDLHMRNILITDRLVSFIDFSNSHCDIAYRDIVNFWLADDLYHLASKRHEAGFGGIRHADWMAFEAGYGAPLSRDPVFQFYYLARIQKQWLHLCRPSRPFDERARTRLQGLADLYDWMLKREAEWSQ